MLLRLAERTPGPPVELFAAVKPMQPDKLRIAGATAQARRTKKALYLARYAAPSCGYTRSSFFIRSYLSGLKAALAEEFRGVAVAALSGPNFCISTTLEGGTCLNYWSGGRVWASAGSSRSWPAYVPRLANYWKGEHRPLFRLADDARVDRTRSYPPPQRRRKTRTAQERVPSLGQRCILATAGRS
jgi:hypothetical protein